MPARVVDLSVDGAGIEHPATLWAGRRVKVWIRHGGHRLMIDAVVVRCRLVPGRDGFNYRSGIRFADMDAGTRSQLHALMADLLVPILRQAHQARLQGQGSHVA